MKYDIGHWEGVFVAMNSCYDGNGDVDAGRARRLTRFLIDRGVQGLYVGGSTGEGMLQSVEERKRMLEAVIAETAGSVKIIAHVGAASTRDAVELARHAEAAGADAISSIPPFYYKPSDEGVRRHWEAMIEACDLPFILYHIPSTTGIGLSPAQFQAMLKNERVAGLKITTPSPYELERFKVAGGERFAVFNGPDEQYLAGRIMGANGGIGGTYGAMPELFVQIERCYKRGDLAGAQLWQRRVNDLITMMLSVPIHGAIKEIIRRRGVDIGAPRMPLEPVGPAHDDAIQQMTNLITEYVTECEKDGSARG